MEKRERLRLDVALVSRGLIETREKAKGCILAGQVYVNGTKTDKAGTMVDNDAIIEIRGGTIPYVSRGGLKLAKALAVFNINLQGALVLDIGASTGGFTDCALKNGARGVIAVDVGYGQLAWTLRQDPRVTCLERVNARYLTKEQLGIEPDFATIDVSFISLDKILPVVAEILGNQGQVVALIKPQFEAGKKKVGKKGVVRDPRVHEEVILRLLGVSASLGFQAVGLDYSPIKGPEGNIEYLLFLTRGVGASLVDEERVKQVVAQAHANAGFNQGTS